MGTDDPAAVPGSSMIGAFARITDLTANFGSNTIAGGVGCTGSVVVSGVFEDGRTRIVTEEAGTSDSVLQLGLADIGSDGTFRSRRESMTNPHLIITSGFGSWGG